ncbi:MAG TPA: amidase [Candidatus Solibacter sp.]|nr:amidase [Candidatus Solibacter sp.]
MIRSLAESLRARRVSSVELVSAAIERIDRLNSQLRAFITVTAEHALHQAREADRELAAGDDRGPLHGIPIALKDLFATKGVRTTAGSRVYENYTPDFDATVVERLGAAGAISVGKLNQHEMAYGITSANPHYGPVRNPWNTEHVPGGSSGGSAAAIAAHIVCVAMGTDTGGSIRIPASFCGTVGIKPTYGRVSRHGVLPLGYSLDHMGPLTSTVRDAGFVMNAIAGPDPKDPTASQRPVEDYVPAEDCSIRGLRIGFPENFFFDRLDSDVESAVRGAIARAESLGASVRQIRLPDMVALNAVARMVLLAEASAVAAPFADRRELFGPDVLALLDQGRLVPAVDYINAQRLRRKMRRDFDALWKDVDCLFTPTTPNTAPKIGDTTVRLGGQDEDVRLATTRLVRGINALGYPAVSMPCGLSGTGLPIGLQIIGAPFQEALILRAAAALEDDGVAIPPCPLGA